MVETDEQTRYRAVLNHMIHVRKVNVSMLTDPIKQLRAQIALTTHNQTEKEREFHRLIM
jgi:hypothetical protein